MNIDATPSSESKALRLARYLKEFVGLRSTTVSDVNKYDAVLWFGEVPQEPECQSPAWKDEFVPGDPWLVVEKQQFPKPPAPPEHILPWVDQQALKRAGSELPKLQSTILEPDLDAKVGDGEEQPLIERHLEDYPEVVEAYDRYGQKWLIWSKEYQRRDRIQSVYAELFRLHTQVQKQGELIEVVLGLGLLSWRESSKAKSVTILRHVVSARVDLHFDPATGVIRLNGAADGAQLKIEDDMLDAELRPERSHYAAANEQLRAIGDDVWDRPRMFAALKSWAGALHPDVDWSPDLKVEMGSQDRPILSFSPALIMRKRNQMGMVRIYDALIDRLASEPDEVPSGWGSLISDEDDSETAATRPPENERSAPSQSGPEEIFFPLPANREQRRIVEAIRHRRGVLVQGPPGTGKSHTIANLVCHLLASGQRVLITAETGRALKVLKDKLPEEIRPLCVSLLGQGGDAFAELNSAVQGITSRFAAWSPAAYHDRIAEIDRELDSNRRTLAQLDAELRSLREDETSMHSLLGGAYAGSASTIARQIAAERERFGWLTLPREAPDHLPVTKADMIAWLRIRRTYDDRAVAQSSLRFVGTDRLPTPEGFAAAIAGETKAKEELESTAGLRVHPAYGPITRLGTGARAKLADRLQQLKESRRQLLRLGHSWLSGALKECLEGRRARWQTLFDQSWNLIGRADRLLASVGSHSITLSVTKDLRAVRADAAAVLDHLKSGGKWTSFGVLTPKVVKDRTYLRQQIAVNGRPPDTPDALQILCEDLDLALTFEELDSIWSDHGGLPSGSPQIRAAAIKECTTALGAALDYVAACQALAVSLSAAAPAIPEPDWVSGRADEWQDIINAVSLEERHRAAGEQVTASLHDLTLARQFSDAHAVVDTLAQAIERRHLAAYSQAYQLVQRIEETRRDRELRERIQAALGAVLPRFLDMLAASVDDPAWDERLADWDQAWRWAVADNWLSRRTDPSYRERIWCRRNEVDESIRGLLAESAALRAWTHFFGRLSHAESAALRSWREAVRMMGMGTGRSARMERLRREARQYMEQCRDAIPVWIMPRYLVAEMVNPAPDRYDTVIVDEASQLGIESLFLFYISKKMIVVGDDQQISPYGVGIADESIANLQHHYLAEIPHHHALSPQSSLYGNAKIRFGQNIVLREHFRCMPEIIQFSNDLCYASNGTPLDPLRSYPANRLRPLVTRHIPDGYRTGSSQNALNEPEADAVIAQIMACVADPRYTGCTMGVISLQGDAQARLIEHKLLETLEPEVIEQRRLICGDAYAFQGDERNVIFLSMVAAPGETRIGVMSNDSARQRFNVAASRAQDQLWLFYTPTPDLLSSTCMRHRLLNYMLNPGRRTTDGSTQQFDSEFERDVFEMLVGRGFHVRTQVCVGDSTNHRYRIDLVVEGMQGRLAVECDGEKWHGPERYEQDMARQRDLERAGWRFVRIRGGDFYRDPDRATEPLWGELDRLGIKAGGIDEAAAEPPPPVDLQNVDRAEIEESDSIPTASDPDGDPDAPEGDGVVPVLKGHVEPERAREAPPPTQIRTPDLLLAKYVVYRGPVHPDPRTVSVSAVADGLCSIIEAEGPMVAKRAYDIYLHCCGIRRLGRELKSTMNKALANAISRGRIVSENEPGKSGLIFSTVRIKGTPPMRLRCRGPRTLEELPPAEVRAVGRRLAEIRDLPYGSDEHLRAILECFDLKRLTKQVCTTLLEILERRDDEQPSGQAAAAGS